MIHYKHSMPPTLVNIGGKRYVVPIWKEVSKTTELKDIQWERVKPKPVVKKEAKILTETFVSSSDDSILYKTKKIEQVNGNFIYSCTCPGAWRAKDKRCKHIKELEKRKV